MNIADLRVSRQVKLIVDCGGSVVYLCPPFYLFRGEFSKEKATPLNPNFGLKDRLE